MKSKQKPPRIMNPEVDHATLCVVGWKHPALKTVCGEILRKGISRAWVFPGDIPEDVVDPQDRQGCASLAWTLLRKQGVLARAPLTLSIPAQGIVGGRKKNQNPSAHGRWVSVYTVPSRKLAESWLKANGFTLDEPKAPEQQNLF